MSFDVPAEAYGRFMGRFSEPLAAEFADFAGVRPGHRALDVGCGPGALTSVLVERLGPDAVTGIDPSTPFVAAARARFPRSRVEQGTAEALPFPSDTFDRTLAQLVVHFMAEPLAGLQEMARVTVSDGTVAACVWDHSGGSGPLSLFWRAAHDVDPAAQGEGGLPGARAGELEELCRTAGLHDIHSGKVTVRVRFADFDDWWEPYRFGVGPAGEYVAGLDEHHLATLRERCKAVFPSSSTIDAAAWAVRARP